MRSKIQTTLLIAAALSVGIASLAEARVMPRPVARPLPATNLHAVSAFKLPHTAFRLPHYVGAVSAIPPHGPWKPPVCNSADCRGNHGAGSNVNGSVSTNEGGYGKTGDDGLDGWDGGGTAIKCFDALRCYSPQ